MPGAHSTEILQGLNDLRQHDILCDVVLEVDQTQIPAHRAVLASFSPYFRLMFTSGLEESKQKVVDMKGIDSESLKNLVNFAYTGDIIVTRENVQNLLPAADLIELPSVRRMCSDFLVSELHPSNCIGIANFADSYRCQDLFVRSTSYICNHFQAVCSEDEFQLLSQEDLMKILSSDDLSAVNNEDRVFWAIQEWIKYDIVSRSRLLDELLLQCFRFKYATSKLLRQLQSNKAIVKCKVMILEAISCKEAKDLSPAKDCNVSKPRQPTDTLCVIGGSNTRFPSLDSIETMGDGDASWEEITDLPECRHKNSAIALNNELYVIGGNVSHVQLNGLVNHDPSNEVLKYDAQSKAWKPVAPMSKNRCSLGTLVYDGYIYAIGGFDGDDYFRCMERYCPLTNAWEIVPSEMATSRSCFGCCCLDGELYAIGGYGPSCLNRWVRSPASVEHIGDNSVEKYSPIAGDWMPVASMSEKRINPGVEVVHGLLYVVGGHNGVAYLSSIERYHPLHNQWTRLTSMTQPRTGMGLAVIGDNLYVAGGFSGTTYLNQVEKYDPAGDTWSDCPGLRLPRAYFAIATINGSQIKKGKC